MRIAVVGSGISGLGSAWLLGRAHEVTLFEANDYLGGHTHTHDIVLEGQHYAVDTGFIVHNPRNYPLLTQLFAELGVASQDSTMSFSVQNERTGVVYETTSLATLFCQRRNLLSARFYGMLCDIVRFYRAAPALLGRSDQGPSLGDYLDAERYGSAFREDHLVPMAAALWSAPPTDVLRFPIRFVVRFMANHNALQLTRRPPWRVVRGGSATYVRALESRWRVNARRCCPVQRIWRDGSGVTVESAAGRERFDQLVLACHSDQALAMLADANTAEQNVLGAIGYQRNEVVLHTDARLLPRPRRAWAAWNALVPETPGLPATVSYCMNLLQNLRAPVPLIVTLNPTGAIAEERVLKRLTYTHPLFTPAAIAAQSLRRSIQGQRRTWFAGAYWGFGFHEDGLRSAAEVSRALGVHWGSVPERPAAAVGGVGELEGVPT